MAARKTEPKHSTIGEALLAITRDIGAIEKSSKAPDAMGGYPFRGIDGVLAALQPQLADKGVILAVEVLDVGAEVIAQKSGSALLSTAKVKYTFHLASDVAQAISHTVVGQGMDRADKGTSKALSTAFKMMCFQAFCIPTDVALDTEADSHEEPVGASRPQPPASHAAKRSQEREDPPPSGAPARPTGRGITAPMAKRLMMAARERADTDSTPQRDELNRGLAQMGLNQVSTDLKTFDQVVAHLMDNCPSKRDDPNAYDQLYEAITAGSEAGPPDGGDDDIPF